jgi:hypothetical protein
MNLILNIGLVSATLGNLTAQQALDAVNAAGIFVYGSQVFESDSEPTLVLSVKFSRDLVAPDACSAVASVLGQDCIAIYAPDLRTGLLVGPRPWGEFDGRFFLMTDGTRLVKEAVPA